MLVGLFNEIINTAADLLRISVNPLCGNSHTVGFALHLHMAETPAAQEELPFRHQLLDGQSQQLPLPRHQRNISDDGQRQKQERPNRQQHQTQQYPDQEDNNRQTKRPPFVQTPPNHHEAVLYNCLLLRQFYTLSHSHDIQDDCG
ncbi:Hypothetical predicted protein [Octopus vulgaris]|uniref:Uncharacterized protein n=1 Tax=Octopus vulgaris TaxID=6645 RepID=A0AA36BX86_OCTVU|nr:Hypothetical predicted protein [Octopus vulgaris]